MVQAPQCAASEEVSTQRPSHNACPTGQGAFGATIAALAEPPLLLGVPLSTASPPKFPRQPASESSEQTRHASTNPRRAEIRILLKE